MKPLQSFAELHFELLINLFFQITKNNKFILRLREYVQTGGMLKENYKISQDFTLNTSFIR